MSFNILNGQHCLFAWITCPLTKSTQSVWKRVWSLGWDDPLENGKATHSSILAWRIPWAVESMGPQIVGHDWATFTSFHFTEKGWHHPIEGSSAHTLVTTLLCSPHSQGGKRRHVYIFLHLWDFYSESGAKHFSDVEINLKSQCSDKEKC